MSSYRISAAMKDSIKNVYGKKISKLNEEYEKLGKEIAEKKVETLNNRQEYKDFKEAYTKFEEWLDNIDPDRDFVDSYIASAYSRVSSKSVFRTPYYYRNNVFKETSPRMKEIEEEKSALNKECNKLLWNIEMSPKSSKEYKDAVAKAEELLFNGELNEN